MSSSTNPSTSSTPHANHSPPRGDGQGSPASPASPRDGNNPPSPQRGDSQGSPDSPRYCSPGSSFGHYPRALDMSPRHRRGSIMVNSGAGNCGIVPIIPASGEVCRETNIIGVGFGTAGSLDGIPPPRQRVRTGSKMSSTSSGAATSSHSSPRPSIHGGQPPLSSGSSVAGLPFAITAGQAPTLSPSMGPLEPKAPNAPEIPTPSSIPLSTNTPIGGMTPQSTSITPGSPNIQVAQQPSTGESTPAAKDLMLNSSAVCNQTTNLSLTASQVCDTHASGWLYKQSIGRTTLRSLLKNWKKRYFHSTPQALEFHENPTSGKKKHSIPWNRVTWVYQSADRSVHPEACDTSKFYFAIKFIDPETSIAPAGAPSSGPTTKEVPSTTQQIRSPSGSMRGPPEPLTLPTSGPSSPTPQNVSGSFNPNFSPTAHDKREQLLLLRTHTEQIRRQWLKIFRLHAPPNAIPYMVDDEEEDDEETDIEATVQDPAQAGVEAAPSSTLIIIGDEDPEAKPKLEGANAFLTAVRSVVSLNKTRFKDKNFDLDLTYITPCIIAMGFPSEGREALYRNSMEDVDAFLTHRHKEGTFKVYNLCSERFYSAVRFKGRFERHPFDDHNAPPLTLFDPFCRSVEAWLKGDPSHVVAVHCKAGKGRTGVMVVAYLMYSGICKNLTEALHMFDTSRTKDGKGVTIKSQKRYLGYAERVYVDREWNGKLPPVRPIRLKRLSIVCKQSNQQQLGIDEIKLGIFSRRPDHMHRCIDREEINVNNPMQLIWVSTHDARFVKQTNAAWAASSVASRSGSVGSNGNNTTATSSPGSPCTDDVAGCRVVFETLTEEERKNNRRMYSNPRELGLAVANDGTRLPLQEDLRFVLYELKWGSSDTGGATGGEGLFKKARPTSHFWIHTSLLPANGFYEMPLSQLDGLKNYKDLEKLAQSGDCVIQLEYDFLPAVDRDMHEQQQQQLFSEKHESVVRSAGGSYVDPNASLQGS